MSVYYVLSGDTILVKGKTYPYREIMRSLGAQYNAADKSWSVPKTPDNTTRVSELCKSVGGGMIQETSRDRGEASVRLSETNRGLETSLSPQSSTSVALFTAPTLAPLPALAPASTLDKPMADGCSIAELMRQAQLAIAQNFPRSLWVIGEIQNMRRHATGVYFQLADSKEGGSQSATVTVNATIWKSQWRDLERKLGPALSDVLQDGFRVRVLADLTLFKDRGQLSLQIQSIDPSFTKGSLALARERLLKELRAKGLDQRNRSLPLPAFPFFIGLLSAEDSRAKSDFIDQLKVYRFPGQLVFFPCQMQGESTLVDVVRGIGELQRLGCDLIVMTRGGGSAADLRWFDSPEIAYAIAEAKVPILAAIGHHEDVCVAEEICFQREKTPTAAADFIISHFQKTRERLDQLLLSLDRLLNERIKLFDALLMQLLERMRGESLNHIHDQRRLVDQAEASFELHWQRRVLQWSSRLEQMARGLGQGLDLRLEREQTRLARAQASLDQGLDLKVEREQARLSQTAVRLEQGLDLRIQREQARIDQQATILHTGALRHTERLDTRTIQLSKDLGRSALQSLDLMNQALKALEAILKQKDPRPWMQQGWTQLFDAKGTIRAGRTLTPGQDIKARLTDSVVDLTVKAIHPSERGES